MKLANLVAFIGLLLAACPAAAQAPEPPIAPAAIGIDDAPLELAPPEPAPAKPAAPLRAGKSPFVSFSDTPWPKPVVPAYPAVPSSRSGLVPVQAEEIVPAPPMFLPAPAVATPRQTGLLPRLVETLQEGGEPTALQQAQPLPTPGMLPSASEIPTEPLTMPAGQPVTAEPIALAPEPYWPRFWTSTEFLLWLMPRQPLPIPLVTTGPATDTVPGALDDPDTVVLFSHDELKYGNYPGARVTMGFWFSRNEIIGMEANAFWVGASSVDLTFDSSLAESGVITRPFINATNNTGGAAAVAFPDILQGQLAIDSDSRLYGGEVNLIGKFCRREHWNLDVIGGYRCLELSEDVEMFNSTLTLLDDVASFLNSPLPAGTTVEFYDRFATKNRFQGGQFGLRTNHCLGALTVSMMGKVAFGINRETVKIRGNTTRILPNDNVASYPAGVFALGSNSGTFSRDEFAVVPQFQFTLAYQCKDWLRVAFNYDLLWWSRLLRPGDQIDPFINPALIPTIPTGFNPNAAPQRPLVPFTATSFWAQGIGLSAEFKY